MTLCGKRAFADVISWGKVALDYDGPQIQWLLAFQKAIGGHIGMKFTWWERQRWKWWSYQSGDYEGCQTPPEAARSRPEAAQKPPEARRQTRKDLLESLQKERGPTAILISHFWPPELWEKNFFCFKPTSLSYFVTAALGNWYQIWVPGSEESLRHTPKNVWVHLVLCNG